MQGAGNILSERSGTFFALRKICKKDFRKAAFSIQLVREQGYIICRRDHEHLGICLLDPEQKLSQDALAGLISRIIGCQNFFDLVNPQDAGRYIVDKL